MSKRPEAVRAAGTPGESSAGGRAPTVRLRPPAARPRPHPPLGECGENKIAGEAHNQLPATFELPSFPGRGAGGRGSGAAARRPAQRRDQNPPPRRPRCTGPSPAPRPFGELVCLIFNFSEASRSRFAGSRAPPAVTRPAHLPAARSARARSGGGEAGRRRGRPGATLRPRSPASAGRLPAPRPMISSSV
ncbi:proapoptotic nucleolar protein 1 [Phocoena phocoena]|uniref:proapoptotic nucleolar protein 1 n=1 Tax=Phocoena phocoena TaxID=9742 RepID=UPI0033077FC0